jgi:hypothetical protein
MVASFDEIMDSMRKEGDLYYGICRDFLPFVVGKSTWDKAIRTAGSLQEISTSSDEAFMLLLLDNHWDEWMSTLEEVEEEVVDNRVVGKKGRRKRKQTGGLTRKPSKYTSSAGVGYNKGWSDKGKKLYKKLRILVDSNRKACPQWDTLFVSTLRKEDFGEVHKEGGGEGGQEETSGSGEDEDEDLEDLDGEFEWNDKLAWL